MLKSDQQGFLIGEVLDVSKALLDGQRSGLARLARIDANVASMLGRPGRPSRPRRSETSPMFPSVPAAESAPRRSGPIIRPYGPVTATVPVATQRDSKGRFIKGSGGTTQPGSGAGGNPKPKEKPAPDEGRTSGENRIVEAIKETAAASTDRMDPMIEAAKEVWEPLGRGWRASFGQSAEKKKERWYKRIWQALTKKKDEEKTVVSGGSQSGGLISGLRGGRGVFGVVGRLASGLLRGVGGVLGRLAPIALGAMPRMGRLAGGLFGGIGAAFGRIGPMLKGVIPRIGALATGLLGRVGGSLARIAPTLMGAMPKILGRVFAPVAALWGAWDVGQWIGGKINEWLVSSGMQDKMFEWIDSMRAGWSSMIDRLSKAWDSLMDGFSSFWKNKIKDPVVNAVDATQKAFAGAIDGGLNLMNGAAKTFANGASATNSWIQQKTGVDAGGAVKSAVTTAGGALGALIGRHEGDYGSFNRGRAGDSKGKSMDFANMSIAEVMALQALPKRDARRLFAVGKYQVIPETMRDAVKALGIKGDEKFTPDMQERIFRDFLIGKKRPAVSDFLSGRSDDVDSAVLELSKEFASVQDPRTGKGYHDGVAGNRASISAVSVRAALMADRSASVASAPTISVPSIRSMSLVKPIGEGPDVAFPSMSGSNEKPIQISLGDQIGQNVSDRAIAHITTGGLGGG